MRDQKEEKSRSLEQPSGNKRFQGGNRAFRPAKVLLWTVAAAFFPLSPVAWGPTAAVADEGAVVVPPIFVRGRGGSGQFDLSSMIARSIQVLKQAEEQSNRTGVASANNFFTEGVQATQDNSEATEIIEPLECREAVPFLQKKARDLENSQAALMDGMICVTEAKIDQIKKHLIFVAYPDLTYTAVPLLKPLGGLQQAHHPELEIPGFVHSGFYERYLHSRASLRVELQKILRKIKARKTAARGQRFGQLVGGYGSSSIAAQDFEVIFTGHSVGGAAATLAAGDPFWRNGFFSSDKIRLITFGAPPALSGQGKDFVEKRLLSATRLRHNFDLVALFPLDFSIFSSQTSSSLGRSFQKVLDHYCGKFFQFLPGQFSNYSHVGEDFPIYLNDWSWKRNQALASYYRTFAGLRSIDGAQQIEVDGGYGGQQRSRGVDELEEEARNLRVIGSRRDGIEWEEDDLQGGVIGQRRGTGWTRRFYEGL